MMMMARDEGSRERLRQATDPAHARVDACFPQGLEDANAYRRYLLGMHALVVALERALDTMTLDPAWREWRDPRREQWLRADLADIGAAPLPEGPALPLSGSAAAAGALYVLEGSSLGARGLLEDAKRLGWSASRGARFLHGHGGNDAGPRWRAYLRCLEGARFAPAEEAGAIQAAARSFAYVEHEFLRAAQAGAGHG
jgi:heme oxygenase